MSTFVVGDVHGRRKQLAHLLSLLPREAGRDTLVLLGEIGGRILETQAGTEVMTVEHGAKPRRWVNGGNWAARARERAPRAAKINVEDQCSAPHRLTRQSSRANPLSRYIPTESF